MNVPYTVLVFYAFDLEASQVEGDRLDVIALLVTSTSHQSTHPHYLHLHIKCGRTHPAKGRNYLSHLLKLEEQHVQEGLKLTAEQIAAIEKANPAFRERHVESNRPGELLSADTFFVGHFKGIGKVYLHTVVDTYGSYGFGFLHTSKQPEAAVAVLHNDVLPFYADLGLTVQAILTDNGREFCGTDNRAYELYLALNDIEHRRTKVRSPQTNGFVERFQRTVLEEFFIETLRTTFYETVDALQMDFDAWLRHYNTERPHQGYRNLGRRPVETIQLYQQSVIQEG
jgi:transposase InsO family protein